MGFLLSKLLPLFIYPLGLGLLLQLAGLTAVARRHPRWGIGLSGVGIGLIWLFSMPFTSRQLVWNLEEKAVAFTPQQIPKADAVVVLGGGLEPDLPPRRGVEVKGSGDRLITGVRTLVQSRTNWLVVSGSRSSENFTKLDPAPPEALSARSLAIELGVPPERILTNPNSRTTAEEARDIGQLARKRGWRTVLLVTSAFHMPRSLATFQQRSGLRVIPVACDYQLPTRARYGKPTAGSVLKGLVPEADALHLSSVALKEHLGLALYRLRGWS
jgi:uncharacterized SAM-binding protein YcdF (DUF218 family)